MQLRLQRGTARAGAMPCSNSSAANCCCLKRRRKSEEKPTRPSSTRSKLPPIRARRRLNCAPASLEPAFTSRSMKAKKHLTCSRVSAACLLRGLKRQTSCRQGRCLVSCETKSATDPRLENRSKHQDASQYHPGGAFVVPTQVVKDLGDRDLAPGLGRMPAFRG